LCQTMVDSWYCLDRVVPERMSQVWRRSEVRNHKRRSLNTRLSSGTSANTSCRSRNAPGRMIRQDLFWYRNNLKVKPTYREKNLLDYFHPKTLIEIAMILLTNRGSFPSNSHVSATFAILLRFGEFWNPTNCEKFNADGSLMGRTNLDKSVW